MRVSALLRIVRKVGAIADHALPSTAALKFARKYAMVTAGTGPGEKSVSTNNAPWPQSSSRIGLTLPDT